MHFRDHKSLSTIMYLSMLSKLTYCHYTYVGVTKLSWQLKCPGWSILITGYGNVAFRWISRIAFVIYNLTQYSIRIGNCNEYIVTLGQNLQMPFLGKKKQHFIPFSRLIREMFLFWNSIFLKSSLKKKLLESYSGVLRSSYRRFKDL